VTLALFLAAPDEASAQWMGKQTDCYALSIAANANRPTVANPPDITQYGVLEVEYGWDQPGNAEDSQAKSVGGLVKFGLLCDVELRLGTTAFQSLTDASGTYSSFGDNWLGTQVRFYRQTDKIPALAFNYAIKIPSSSTTGGLGSGRVDNSFALLAGKDIAHVHLDFNVTYFLIGRSDGSGFDRNQEYDLAFSRFIYRKLQGTGEFYGVTRLNQETPAFASTLWALTYTIVPRLVIDGGFEVGLTSGGPHLREFVGATYSITNIYALWRRKRTTSSDH
jgi:hypothetical protein